MSTRREFKMAKSNKKGGTRVTKKQLINLPEDQKAWIGRVIELSRNAGHETTQTELIRIMIGQHMIEDPEAFVEKIGKLKLRAKLDDIERRERALAQEKEKLAEQLSRQDGKPRDGRIGAGR